MGKGAANKNLSTNAGYGSSVSGQLNAKAGDVGGYLTPQLESEASNPEGYTPQQLAYMNTASQQSTGGSVSGATGEANLTAARTRNAGGYQGAIASSARSAQRQNSQNALQIQTNQANLQQQQRQQALQALQQLYGVDMSTALGYLNSSDTALADEKSKNPNSTANSAIGAAGTVGAGVAIAL